MNDVIKVVGLSDVSLGYGSPQLPSLTRSLSMLYQPSEGYLLEPDQSVRPPIPEAFPDVKVLRIPTRFSYYSAPAAIEYLIHSAGVISRLKPAVLVVSSLTLLPVIMKSRHKPRFIIYYVLESVDHFLDRDTRFDRFLVELSRSLIKEVDLLLYPEENRAARDIEFYGDLDIPIAIVYNAINHIDIVDKVVPSRERNGRILYSGTIERGRTFAEYFLREEVAAIAMDLYGLIEGPDRESLHASLTHANGNIRYLGYLTNAELGQVRRGYAYSLIMWSPSNFQQLNAAPNKLFEAIADGVPPIAAPHPQCEMIINRYRCGVLMTDWTFESFRAALERAIDAFGTSEYDEMVENCRRAVKAELNWDVQFEKVKRLMPKEF